MAGGRIEWPIHVTGSVSRIMLHPRLRCTNRSLSCTTACIMTRHPVTQGLLSAARLPGPPDCQTARLPDCQPNQAWGRVARFSTSSLLFKEATFLIGRVGPFNTGLLAFRRPLISLLQISTVLLYL